MKRILLTLCVLACLPLAMNAQCGLWHDGFETGGWGTGWTAGGSYTRTYPSTGSPVGTYHFSNSGSSGHFGGHFFQFAPSTPGNISFWVKTSNTSAHSAYFVIGDNSITSNYGTIFIYIQNTSRLRFYANPSADYTYSVSANTWYYVELKNLNFSTYTYDIWIDNVQRYTGLPFRNNTATIDRVHIYNLGTAVGSYDDITIGGNPLNLTGNATGTLCAGDSTGSASINVSGGTPNYSYNWNTGGTTNTISGLSPGTYYVTVTDSVGCVSNDSITVSSPPAISASFSTSPTLCPGTGSGSIDLTPGGGTPGYSYAWSTGATTQDVNGLVTGTYSVVITDSNGCSHTDSASVAGPAPWNINQAITHVGCYGDSTGAVDMTITGANPGYSFNWSNGATSEDLSGIGPGTYTVLITDSLGCNRFDTVAVTQPDSIVLGPTVSDLNCNGDQSGEISLTTTGGTPVFSYAWSNGDTGSAASGLPAGTYSVSVTDANGCQAGGTYTVNEPPAMTSSGAVTGDAGGGTGAIDLTVGGGTPNYTFSWSNGATSEDLSSIAAGTYTVLITDANGCTLTDTFVVSEIVGITDPAGGFEMSAYPNPVQHELVISLSQLKEKDFEIALYDQQGRLVLTKSAVANGSAVIQKISTDQLAKGIYLLQVRVGEQFGVARIVKE